MKKKEISAKTAIKGLINGFLAYGILLIFIFFCIMVFVAWEMDQYKDLIDYDTLKYSVPILGAFIIFFVVRAVCRLSTFDLFKKCKIKEEDIDKVSTMMNLFFIGCIVFFVIFIICVLSIRFSNQKGVIQETINTYYDNFSTSYADYLTIEIINDFQSSRLTTLIQTVIIEAGLVAGLFSLVSAQKKMIHRYNYDEDNAPKKDEKNQKNKGKHASENA